MAYFAAEFLSYRLATTPLFQYPFKSCNHNACDSVSVSERHFRLVTSSVDLISNSQLEV